MHNSFETICHKCGPVADLPLDPHAWSSWDEQKVAKRCLAAGRGMQFWPANPALAQNGAWHANGQGSGREVMLGRKASAERLGSAWPGCAIIVVLLTLIQNWLLFS